MTVKDAEYNPEDDLARGIDACYAAIRERVSNGGKPWQPPEAVSRETGEMACRPKPSS
jgi:hypothetical protein